MKKLLSTAVLSILAASSFAQTNDTLSFRDVNPVSYKESLSNMTSTYDWNMHGAYDSSLVPLDQIEVGSRDFSALYNSLIENLKEADENGNHGSSELPSGVMERHVLGSTLFYKLEDFVKDDSFGSFIEGINGFGASFDPTDKNAFLRHLYDVRENGPVNGQYPIFSEQRGEAKWQTFTYAVGDIDSYIDTVESLGFDSDESRVVALTIKGNNWNGNQVDYSIVTKMSADGNTLAVPTKDDVYVTGISKGVSYQESPLSEFSASDKNMYEDNLVSLMALLNNELGIYNEPASEISLQPAYDEIDVSSRVVSDFAGQTYTLDNGVKIIESNNELQVYVPVDSGANSGVLVQRGSTLSSPDGELYKSVSALDDGTTKALDTSVDIMNGMLYHTFVLDKDNLDSDLARIAYVGYSSTDGARGTESNANAYKVKTLGIDLNPVFRD